jgi:nucleotide-binding universal stress UspA family protein
MTRILVAIESSEFSTTVIEALRRQFRSAEPEISLLHVIDPLVFLPLYEGAARDFARIDALRAENLKKAQAFMDEAAKALAGSGYRVTSAIEEGEPRTTIVDYAERVKADLVIVGSHGRRGLPRLLLGSVSEYVARHAPCSVEIVREQPLAA